MVKKKKIIRDFLTGKIVRMTPEEIQRFCDETDEMLERAKNAQQRV